MGFLQKLAAGIANFFRRVAGLILPFLADARDYEGWGTGLRWLLTILLLAGISAGLWWANNHFGVDKFVTPTVLRNLNLHKFFLPILFLLVVALCWLGWLLWKLLGPEEESIEFPDVRGAWEEGVRALNQAGIDLTEVPLFLVLGKTAAGEEALFNAAQLQLTVKYAPKRDDAPLHVYGNRDGIYVTCAGASLLGRQAAILTGEVGAAPAASGEAFPTDGGAAEDDPYKTVLPKGQIKEVQAILAKAQEMGRDPAQLSEEEKAEIRRLLVEEKGGRPRFDLLKDAAEVGTLTARLRYLCRLIVRDRQPYCPLNGIMLLVPFAAADKDDDAQKTGTICQRDLTSLRKVLQVNCPMIALICDLETAPGFREFITRFPSEQRQRRLGQRFPLAPDLNPGESAIDLIDKGVQWVCASLIPTWVHKLFRVEAPPKEEFAAAVAGNTRLYQLLNAMRERRKRFGQVLVKALAAEGDGPLLFGGCYVAGTGRDLVKEQAFVAGVFRRLIENQNFVSWTSEAVREESDYERWTRLGYIGIGVGCFALAALAGFSFFGKA